VLGAEADPGVEEARQIAQAGAGVFTDFLDGDRAVLERHHRAFDARITLAPSSAEKSVEQRQSLGVTRRSAMRTASASAGAPISDDHGVHSATSSPTATPKTPNVARAPLR
jgi:hypothetical protein